MTDRVESMQILITELIDLRLRVKVLLEEREWLLEDVALFRGERNALRAELAALEQQGEPVAKRIAEGTAVDWWWKKTDCPVGTKLYTALKPEE